MAKGLMGDVAGMALAAALKANSMLQALELTGPACAMGIATGRAMAEALAVNTTLQSLVLAGQGINDDVGVALAEALKENGTLRHLRLAGRFIGTSPAFASAMADALAVNRTLKSLGLENHNLVDSACAELAQLLGAHIALESLHLVCAGIGNVTGLAVAQALARNVHLKSLHLDGLHLGEPAVVAIAESLHLNASHNGRLSRLALSNPCLDICPESQAGRAMAAALSQNRVLARLELTFSYVGDSMGVPIAEALRSNSALVVLHLHGEGMTDRTVEALRAALETNVVLRALQLNTVSADFQIPNADPDHTPHVALDVSEQWNWPDTSMGREVCAALERNRLLPEHWRHLVLLARKTQNPRVLRAVAAMTECGFRRAVFSFFVPPGAALPLAGSLRTIVADQ